MSLALFLLAASASETIAMNANSWGKPLTSWTMAADGSIEFHESIDLGGDFFHYRDELRRTPPDAARRKWLVAQLAPLRSRTSHPPECGQRMTDMVYGDVSWGEGDAAAKLHFDDGCMAPEARAMITRLRAADDQVRIWARKAPVAESREMNPPQ